MLGCVSNKVVGPGCEICLSPDIVRVHDSLNVGRCSSCGLVSLIVKPSAEQVFALYSSTTDYENYVAAQRDDALDKRYAATLGRLQTLLSARPGQQVLFDVGAGAGAFLERAAKHGFDVCGNEISSPASQLCFEQHGIRLSNAVLEEESGQDRFDAMTMWCVLAHVTDPRAALAAALRLIKPGGVLYFQTPRWCAMDTAGLALCRITRGRLSLITNRRISLAHMRLYDRANLSQLVADVGFEVIHVRPKATYSLKTVSYLESLNFPQVTRQPLSRALDLLIDRNLFPRNVLEVYLRKPRPAQR